MEFNTENMNHESPDMSEIRATEGSQSGSSLLDFDASALVGSPPPAGSDLNTQALCFSNSDLSFLDDQSTSFTQLPMPSQISFSNDFAKTDDIR